MDGKGITTDSERALEHGRLGLYEVRPTRQSSPFPNRRCLVRAKCRPLVKSEENGWFSPNGELAPGSTSGSPVIRQLDLAVVTLGDYTGVVGISNEARFRGGLFPPGGRVTSGEIPSILAARCDISRERSPQIVKRVYPFADDAASIPIRLFGHFDRRLDETKQPASSYTTDLLTCVLSVSIVSGR